MSSNEGQAVMRGELDIEVTIFKTINWCLLCVLLSYAMKEGKSFGSFSPPLGQVLEARSLLTPILSALVNRRSLPLISFLSMS